MKRFLFILVCLIILSCFASDDFYQSEDDDDKYAAGNQDDNNDAEEEEQQEQTNSNTSNSQVYFTSDGTIDFSKFAIKFHSCRSLNMESFNVEDYTKKKNNNDNNNNEEEESTDDEENDQDDTFYNYYNKDENYVSEYQYPYNTAQVVSYRLCPVDQCNDKSWNGCRQISGNYMMNLEDYIEMHQNDVSERIEQYCDYCQRCEYMKSNFGYKCSHYYDCYTSSYDYSAMCQGGNNNAVVDYSQYLECTEVEAINEYSAYVADDDSQDDYLNGRRKLGDADKVFVKIYCDGSIKLGLFSDQSCSNYIGDSSVVYSVTGITGIEDDLNDGITNSRCLSCSKEKSKYFAMTEEMYNNKKAGYYDDEDELFEICENLVDESIQCNAKLDQNHKFRQSRKFCNVIDSFQKGHIDASGNLIHKMTKMQWFVLLIIIPGCIATALLLAFFAYISRGNSIDNDDLDDNLVPTSPISDGEAAVMT